MSLSAADRLIMKGHEIQAFDQETGFGLDNGAGTGALTTTLKPKHPALRVMSADISPGMLKTIEEKYIPNTETLVLDASKVNGPPGNRTFSHVLSTFMMTYLSSPINSVREMHQVLRPEGFIGIGVWGEKNGPLIIWNVACQKLDPPFEPKPLGPSAWVRPEQVEAALSAVGLGRVKSELFPMLIEMGDVDAFLHFWFESKNPMAAKRINGWKGKWSQ